MKLARLPALLTVMPAGRDPASLEISLMGPKNDADELKRLADMGVHRAVAMLPSVPAAVRPVISSQLAPFCQ